MTAARKWIIFGSGVLVGGMIALALLSNLVTPQVAAQAPPPRAPAEPHFQLSSWGAASGYGAYILNTHTGEVFIVIANGKPQLIGKAEGK